MLLDVAKLGRELEESLAEGDVGDGVLGGMQRRVKGQLSAQ